MKLAMAALFCVLVTSPVHAGQESPYKGEEKRPIKSLSEDEIIGYRQAHGMGFAKVAELNHYPGPKHVLDLADELALTPGQVELTRAAFDAMHESASTLGDELVALEGRIDALFAAGAADDAKAEALIMEIAQTRGAIRFAHVRAHIAMKEILSAEQAALYDELRGYSTR